MTTLVLLKYSKENLAFSKQSYCMHYLILFFLFIACHFSAIANDITRGVPFIVQYSDKDYEVSNNNWDIVQDQRGIIYIANEYGILEFDGSHWEIIQVPSNRSNIRSLALDCKGRLYAGAQGDFGYVGYSETYGLHFISLLDKVPEEYKDFADVWKVVIQGEKVIFHSWKALFIYENDEVKVIHTGNKIKGVFKVYNKLLVQDEVGLFELTDNELMLLPRQEQFKRMEIRFILPYQDHALLLGTHLHGLFVWKDDTLKPYRIKPHFDFEAAKITDAHVRKDGSYVVGTINQGICLFNPNGEMIMHLSKQCGIQNNEIRHLFSDRNDNLWVANKKGIDFIELASPLSAIVLDPEEPLGVYSVASDQDKLFFATHNGIFQVDSKQMNKISTDPMVFAQVKGSSDVNWNLNKVDNELIVSHAKGFSAIRNGKFFPLYNENGAWKVLKLPDHPTYLLGGTYNGLVLFKKVGSKYVYVNKIEGFDESSRVIETDNEGNIWVAHGYKGIYRLSLSDDLSKVKTLSFYNREKGLPSDIYNSVFKIWGEVVFGTQAGFYRYDAANDSMLIHDELNDLVGNGQGRKLQEDVNGNVWFVAGEESGIINKHADGSLSVEKNPFVILNDLYIPGFENFFFLDQKYTLIGTKNGVVLYDPSKNDLHAHKSHVLLRNVLCLQDNQGIYSDRYEYLCDTLVSDSYVFPFNKNSLQFSFSSGFYENAKEVKYKYFLQGFDSDWSDWKSEQYKDYTNLHEGEYLFRVKAMNGYNAVSDEAIFKFVVLPPLHRTKMAYFLYLLVIVLLFLLFLKVKNIKAQREKDRYIKEQVSLRELEHAHYHEEKLQKELKMKDQELSGLAMKVIYKNEKLTELKEKVSGVRGVASDRVSKKLSDVLEFINKELDDDNWDDFEFRFDQAHDDFIKKLKGDYPELTSKDLKICAYLKMNLTSKEIANLLNMTVRGVENARYRVRKRMRLDASVHLTEWLLLRK
jgi:ligand-binding sensor domain-containing protein/DNA-binding CsgD family transcriptional regulator